MKKLLLITLIVISYTALKAQSFPIQFTAEWEQKYSISEGKSEEKELTSLMDVTITKDKLVIVHKNGKKWGEFDIEFLEQVETKSPTSKNLEYVYIFTMKRDEYSFYLVYKRTTDNYGYIHHSITIPYMWEYGMVFSYTEYLGMDEPID